jgi:hypothetical protein
MQNEVNPSFPLLPFQGASGPSRIEYKRKESHEDTDLWRAVMSGDVQQVARALVPDTRLKRETCNFKLRGRLAAMKHDVSLLRFLCSLVVEWPLVHLAAHTGHIDMIRALIEARADIHARDEDHRTCLHRVHANRPDIVSLLLDHGADKDAQDGYGCTPLHQAVGAKDCSHARILLERGANMELILLVDQQTPLCGAVAKNDKSMVQLLLSYKARVDVSDGVGFTALHGAVSGRKRECVQLLLQAGADPNQRTHDGRNALEVLLGRFKRDGDLIIYDLFMECPSLIHTTALSIDDDAFCEKYGFDLRAFRNSRTLWRSHAQNLVNYMEDQAMPCVLTTIVLDYCDDLETRRLFMLWTRCFNPETLRAFWEKETLPQMIRDDPDRLSEDQYPLSAIITYTCFDL